MFEHKIQIIINKCNYSLTTDFYFFNENLDREEIIANESPEDKMLKMKRETKRKSLLSCHDLCLHHMQSVIIKVRGKEFKSGKFTR